MRTVWILLVLALFSGNAAAEMQTISGKVLEQGSNRPVVDAVVFLADNDRVSSTTDDAGRFTLEVGGPGDYALGAVAVGYPRVPAIQISVVPGADPVETTFYLVAENANSEIVVYRARDPSRVSKTVITAEVLRTIPGSGSDPLRGLQAFPGVITGSDVSSAPAIRGSRPEDNLYFVDDLPVGYLFHLGGVVSVFNGDLVDNFNLYASAFGPEYGDVTGAVIDVALRNPRTDLWRRKVNISLTGADAMIEGPVTNNQSFYFSARRSYFDLVIDKINDAESGATIEIPNYYDYQGKYVWRLGTDNTLTGHLNGARDEVTFTVDPDGDLAERNPDLVGSSSISQAYHTQAVTLDTQLSAKSKNRVAFGRAAQTSDSIVGSAADVHFAGSTWYLRERYNVRVNPQHDVMAGASYSWFNVDLDLDAKNCPQSADDLPCDRFSAPRKQYKDQLAVNFWEMYARDRWRIVDDVTLIGGLRFSHEDYLGEYFTEPRVGMEWDVGANTLITAGWGQHHQFPDGAQVAETFGNPNLHNTRAEHRVVGVGQTIASWSWKVEAYYKDYDRLVLADPVLNYRNSGSGHAYGVETLIKKAETGRWSGWYALSLARSIRRNENTSESFAMDFDQPVNMTAVLSFRASARWLFGAKWTYHSGNPYTPILNEKDDPTPPTYPDGRIIPIYGEINSRRLPAYHRLDLRADRRVEYKTWTMNYYIEIINAYNQKNVAGYRYDPVTYERTTTYQLPLIPSFGVQAEF